MLLFVNKLLPIISSKLFFSTTSKTIIPIHLEYLTYGSKSPTSASPVLIVHGLFGSKTNWSTNCKFYQENTSPHRRIITLDLRNHGRSPHTEEHTYDHLVADLKKFTEDSDIKKATLMGHSMGGRAVMLLALRYPELVERMIVVDISPLSSNRELLTLRKTVQALYDVKLPTEGPLSKAKVIVEQQLSNSIPNKNLRMFLMTNLLKNEDGSFRWKMNVASLLKNFDNIVNFPSVSGMKYHGPVLMLAGTESDFLPEHDIPEILEIFPKADIKYIDGAGHLVHADKPKEFAAITLEFLNKKI